MSAETFPETFEDLLRVSHPAASDAFEPPPRPEPERPEPERAVLERAVHERAAHERAERERAERERPGLGTSTTARRPAVVPHEAASWFGPAQSQGTDRDPTPPTRRPLASQWHAATRAGTRPSQPPTIGPPFGQEPAAPEPVAPTRAFALPAPLPAASVPGFPAAGAEQQAPPDLAPTTGLAARAAKAARAVRAASTEAVEHGRRSASVRLEGDGLPEGERFDPARRQAGDGDHLDDLAPVRSGGLVDRLRAAAAPGGRYGTERNGTERNGTERNGTERNGAERKDLAEPVAGAHRDDVTQLLRAVGRRDADQPYDVEAVEAHTLDDHTLDDHTLDDRTHDRTPHAGDFDDVGPLHGGGAELGQDRWEPLDAESAAGDRILAVGPPIRPRADRRRDDPAGLPSRRAMTIGVVGGLAATVALAAVVTGALHAADQADLRAASTVPTASRPAGPAKAPKPSGSSAGSAVKPSSVPSPSQGSPAPGTGTAGKSVSESLYWLTGSSRTGIRLVREIRPTPDRGDAITSAIDGVLTQQPLDHGYRSPWRPTQRLIVHLTTRGITLDLGSDAFAPGIRGLQARVAVQTLVWTATAAINRQLPVTILVDGRAGYRAWGTVTLGRAMLRDVEVRAVVAIETPLESASLPAGLVRLTGIGAPADRRFSYVVRRGGVVVASGTSPGTTSPRPDWWFFDIGVTLPAGHYTATVSVTGAGTRAGHWTDDRDFDVH